MKQAPHVALFVTCLVDVYRPSVGFAAIRLLERAGCRVSVPAAQTCCGQPAYNSGDRRSAIRLARAVVDAFADADYVVAPSGSCAGMLSKHLPALLADDPVYAERAAALAGRCHELTAFLVDVCGMAGLEARFDGRVTYHDSCSALREGGVAAQPRQLMAQVAGLDLVEAAEREACCGFGGTFCVKYPEISVAMVDRKVDAIAATGAELVLAGDLGCLLNIAGRLSRRGLPCRARHVAEVLAGLTDGPPIGGPAGGGSPGGSR
ncbi:MAG: (Fe-S)-binding protein [Sneathiellaceae bacterium]